MSPPNKNYDFFTNKFHYNLQVVKAVNMVVTISYSPLDYQLAHNNNNSYEIMNVVENRWAHLSTHVQSVVLVEPISVAHWKCQKVEAHAIRFVYHLTWAAFGKSN